MEDDFFDIKRYLGKWTPEFYFAELGDTDNFFIHLEYFVNKSRYVSTKSEIGSALDFNMVDGDGVGVFDDLPASTRSMLQRRGYKLAFISDGKPQNPDGDLFLVSEVYTYAPTKQYVDYESDIVPIWGLHAEFDVSSNVIFGRRNVIESEYYHNTTLQVDNIGIFQTGDHVDVYVKNVFIQKQHFGAGISAKSLRSKSTEGLRSWVLKYFRCLCTNDIVWITISFSSFVKSLELLSMNSIACL